MVGNQTKPITVFEVRAFERNVPGGKHEGGGGTRFRSRFVDGRVRVSGRSSATRCATVDGTPRYSRFRTDGRRASRCVGFGRTRRCGGRFASRSTRRVGGGGGAFTAARKKGCSGRVLARVTVKRGKEGRAETKKNGRRPAGGRASFPRRYCQGNRAAVPVRQYVHGALGPETMTRARPVPGCVARWSSRVLHVVPLRRRGTDPGFRDQAFPGSA